MLWGIIYRFSRWGLRSNVAVGALVLSIESIGNRSYAASAPLLIPPGRALHFAYPPALRARASMARVALLAQKCHYGLGKHKTSRDSP